jgi:hypothetical protein
LAGALIGLALIAGACGSDEPEAAPDIQAQSFDNGDENTGDSEIVAGDAESTVAGDADDAASGETEAIVTEEDKNAVFGMSPAESAEEVGDILNETGQNLADEELLTYLARRYEAYWYAFDIARRAPSDDPAADYPALDNLAAGEQLDQAYEELGQLFTNGHAIREPETPAIAGLDENSSLRIRFENIEEGVAELVSCLVNDQVIYDTGDGSIISDSVRTVRARATMAKADGTWKVIRSQATGLDAGVGGCWLEGEERYPY